MALSKVKNLYEWERKKLDKMLSDDNTDLAAGMHQSGFVIGLAAAYIEKLEEALAANGREA